MRTAMTVAGLATAGLCTLTFSQTANAAQGELLVSGTAYTNPSGCYESRLRPMVVRNRTDEPAIIFDQPGCRGRALAVVRPGQTQVAEFGHSVRIR